MFVSFVNSQTGMIRHWNRNLPLTEDPARRRQMKRSRVINTVGAVVTSLVLVIILVSKFTEGAWIAIVAMVVLFTLMRGIRHHYDLVQRRARPRGGRRRPALAGARGRPGVEGAQGDAACRQLRPGDPAVDLVALTVDVDHEARPSSVKAEWERRGIPVPLQDPRLAVPRGHPPDHQVHQGDQPLEPARRRLDLHPGVRRRASWWEQLLHNQSALRLKGRLLFMRGVMVTSVPYQLASSGRRRRSARPSGGRRRPPRRSSVEARAAARRP